MRNEPELNISVDEYPMSIGSPFYVDEYYFGAPSSLSPQSNGLSHEFSVNEYHYDEEIEMVVVIPMFSTSCTGGGHTNVHDRDEAPNVSVKEIRTASPMQFRWVPRRNSRGTFALLTYENQLKLDVGNDCCTRCREVDTSRCENNVKNL